MRDPDGSLRSPIGFSPPCSYTDIRCSAWRYYDISKDDRDVGFISNWWDEPGVFERGPIYPLSLTLIPRNAAAQAKAGAGAVRDDTRQTAEYVQKELASAAENVKGRVGEVANTVNQQARKMADDQKAAGAE